MQDRHFAEKLGVKSWQQQSAMHDAVVRGQSLVKQTDELTYNVPVTLLRDIQPCKRQKLLLLLDQSAMQEAKKLLSSFTITTTTTTTPSPSPSPTPTPTPTPPRPTLTPTATAVATATNNTNT